MLEDVKKVIRQFFIDEMDKLPTEVIDGIEVYQNTEEIDRILSMNKELNRRIEELEVKNGKKECKRNN